VRGADTKNKDLTLQSRGLLAIVAIAEGFRLISSNDYENMEKAVSHL